VFRQEKDRSILLKPTDSAASEAAPCPYQSFIDANPEIAAVDLLIPDIGGVIRGKRIPVADLPKLASGNISLPGSLFALDVTGENVSGTGLVWRSGDADHLCTGIPDTLCVVPWAVRPTAQVMISMLDSDGETPMPIEPRNVLKRVVERLHAEKLFPVAAIELEFYLIDPNWREIGGSHARPIPPQAPIGGNRPNTTQVYNMDDLDSFEPVINDIYDAAALQGIPATTSIAEYGPGQFEINFNHVKDPVKAADQAILFKRLVKGIADHHGLEATFMAKIASDLSGNGMHIHCSLEDENGDNVFSDIKEPGKEPRPSPVLLNAVGGLCETMTQTMALLAPHGNSYRRFQRGSYAPMAPNWGYNNRTVAMRIPLGARRVEHRVAGADANPYLVMAAVLAGMHYGIAHDVEPPGAIEGNAYERLDNLKPPHWANALDDFHASDFIRTYFGERFLKTYLAIKRNELNRYIGEVPMVDYDWYLRTT